MTDAWADLDEAIRADDNHQVEMLLGRMSEKERKALWPQLRRVMDRRYGRDSPYDRELCTIAVATAWTAPSAKEFSDHIWRAWPIGRAVELEVADSLEARGVGWIAKVRLVGRHGAEVRWRLHRELLRRGLVERGDDLDYLRGMVIDISRPRWELTLRDALLADPGLLQSEVYELFDHEDLGLWLAHSENDTGRDDADLRADRWSWVLADLAAEGHLDRARLLAAAHDALVRDITWNRRRWPAQVIDRLRPSLDELDRHQVRYLQLLSAGDSPGVRFGQSGVRRLLDAGRIDPADFLRGAEGPLLRKEKQIALEQLRLVAPFLDAEATRDEAARVVGAALTHPRADVQRRALRLLGPHLVELSDGCRDELRSLLDSSAPSVRADAPELLTRLAQGSDTAHDVRAPDAIAWTPPPLPPAARELDDDELTEGLLLLMGRQPFAPLVIDEVLDGVLRRAGSDTAELELRLSPAVTQARRIVRSGNLVAALVLDLVGETRDSTERAVRADRVVVAGRIAECRDRVRQRQPSLLLSLPTDPAGRLDPVVLDERLRQSGTHLPGETSSDRIIAELRAGRAEIRLRPHRPDAWTDPTTYTVGASWHVSGVEEPYVAWLTAWPHHVDAVIAHVLPQLRHDLEHEPTAYSPSLLGPLCEWLVTLDAPLSAAGTAAIALALTARAAQTRLSAVDAAAAVLHGGHVRTGDLAAACAAQAHAGIAKVNRLATSLDELRSIRAECARDLAMATAAALVDHRDVAKLLVVASEATAIAGGAPLPRPLVELSGSRRRSRAVAEARRLRSMLGDPPDE